MSFADWLSRVHLPESNGPGGILKSDVGVEVVVGVAGDGVAGITTPGGASKGAAGMPTPGGATWAGCWCGGTI